MEGDEAGLEGILDHLLEESSGGGGRAQPHRDTVTATVTYVIDRDAPMDTDETLHDSRMVSHSDSQVCGWEGILIVYQVYKGCTQN